jgi:hypothetical protein
MALQVKCLVSTDDAVEPLVQQNLIMQRKLKKAG